MNRHNGDPGTPLPVPPRQRQGETADSYLRRLAAANHLRFSYLRRYLATPRGSYGPVDAWGLAVLAGREPRAILRASAKLERYAEIRRDAGAGMSERAIERKHHVGRRTIVKALDSPDPPPRKKIHREPAALNGLHVRIDTMIEAHPAITTTAVWQRLADNHGVTVAYPTLRTYVTSRRAAMRAQHQPQSDGTGVPVPAVNLSQARAGNRYSVLAGRWSVPPEGPDG